MADIFISEYTHLARDADGNVLQAPKEPAVVEQNITIGIASVQSAAFGTATRFVRIEAGAACCILFGESPTAVATKKAMASGSTEFFGVTPGHKVAVIQA